MSKYAGCKGCVYYRTLGTTNAVGGKACHYLFDTGKLRGCEVTENGCDKKKIGKNPKKRKWEYE